MGHVSTGPLRQEGQGHDVPRRQHRGAGTGSLRSIDPALRRHLVGRLGERLAERFLVGRGATVLGRNVHVGRGEVDLHIRVDASVVAVEVKTLVRSRYGADPADHYDEAKQRQVWSLTRLLDPPAHRVDLVTVIIDAAGAEITWVPEG